MQANQDSSQNPSPGKRRYTRRQFLAQSAAVAVIAPALVAEATVPGAPVGSVLYGQFARLLSKLTNLDHAINQASQYPPEQNDAVELMEVWLQADTATDQLKALLLSARFTEEAVIPLVGQAAWDAACIARFGDGH